MESKLGRAKQIATHPGSVWATLLAVAIGVLQALTGTQSQALDALGFAQQTESSHHAALSDIRAKVDWLYVQVQGHGAQLAKLSVTPGGPSDGPPPPSAAPSEETPTDTPSATKAPRRAPPFPLTEQGTPVWEPIKRPSPTRGQSGVK